MAMSAKMKWRLGLALRCHYDFYLWSKIFVSISNLYKCNINVPTSILAKI